MIAMSRWQYVDVRATATSTRPPASTELVATERKSSAPQPGEGDQFCEVPKIRRRCIVKRAACDDASPTSKTIAAARASQSICATSRAKWAPDGISHGAPAWLGRVCCAAWRKAGCAATSP